MNLKRIKIKRRIVMKAAKRRRRGGQKEKGREESKNTWMRGGIKGKLMVSLKGGGSEGERAQERRD